MNSTFFTAPMPRRAFIRSAAILSAVGSAGPISAIAKSSPAPPGKRIPVGLQLYSLREECKKDLAGMLAEVAKIGYKGVEFAGYHGHSAVELRKMLDANGLVACGSHTPYPSVVGNEINATIEFNKVIGNHFLIVPSMTVKSASEWLEKARLFNDLAARLKPLSMYIGYHSHAHDFRKYEGKTSWDIFAENTRPEVILQLDTSNCRDGGAEPVEVLKKYPGRVKSIHIKPSGAGGEAVIGEDKIDWAAVFSFCEGPGKTEWYVVEHETSKQPVEAVRRTFDALKRLGKV
jgi:sugar phosphate isomerase/epimerase